MERGEVIHERHTTGPNRVVVDFLEEAAISAIEAYSIQSGIPVEDLSKLGSITIEYHDIGGDEQVGFVKLGTHLVAVAAEVRNEFNNVEVGGAYFGIPSLPQQPLQ